jgi:hypothetical protein
MSLRLKTELSQKSIHSPQIGLLDRLELKRQQDSGGQREECGRRESEESTDEQISQLVVFGAANPVQKQIRER